MRNEVEVVIGEIEGVEVAGGALIGDGAGEAREVIVSSDCLAKYAKISSSNGVSIFNDIPIS